MDARGGALVPMRPETEDDRPGGRGLGDTHWNSYSPFLHALSSPEERYPVPALPRT